MFVLGIVGSPAGGKSTVAGHLQDLGATWIDADQVVRSVLEKDEIQKQLIDYFGSKITGNDGRIDRAKLASCVFGDDDSKRPALTYLEGLIHPQTRLIITAKLRAAMRQGSAVAILDVPMLFESGWDRACDEIWCVDSDRSVRLARAKKRGWDDQQLGLRESNQLDIEEKKRLSNVFIYNNGTLDELHETIECLWSSFLGRDNELITNPHCLEEDPVNQASASRSDQERT
jgi:dephospho-CoA kinase